MKTMNFDPNVQSCGGVLLEHPIPLHAMLDWLSADSDGKPKCHFTPL